MTNPPELTAAQKEQFVQVIQDSHNQLTEGIAANADAFAAQMAGRQITASEALLIFAAAIRKTHIPPSS